MGRLSVVVRLRSNLIKPILLGAATAVIAGCADRNESTSNRWQAEQAMQKDGVVRQNMRAVQVAAEHFAADHGGDSYPVQIDDSFKTYLPGGVEGQTPSPVGPANPFTGLNEFPHLGNVGDVAGARSGPRFAIEAGRIEYTPLSNGRGYTIVGGAHDGKALADIYNPGQVLVLTNVRD